MEGRGNSILCIISGNYLEAKNWAFGQQLDDHEWFFPISLDDLNHRKDFHVIVVGSAGENVPIMVFEKLYQLAKIRGRIK